MHMTCGTEIDMATHVDDHVTGDVRPTATLLVSADNGERRRSTGGEGYWCDEEAIAHLKRYSLVDETYYGGWRRALSDGEVRRLSRRRSDDASRSGRVLKVAPTTAALGVGLIGGSGCEDEGEP